MLLLGWISHISWNYPMLIFFLDISSHISVKWQDSVETYVSSKLVPIDWASLTIILHSKNKDSVELVDPKLLHKLLAKKQLSLQDPRTSVTGLHFLWWWSEGLQKKHTKGTISLTSSIVVNFPMACLRSQRVIATFTYLTSLLYEWEKDPHKSFVIVER